MPENRGTLFIVATPIGNLGDITYRAVETLRGAAVIACEDTRHTRKLLTHFAIATPTVSLHEHNEAARTAELITRIEGGESVALVSDAGTPLVSDPGFRLVRDAAARGIRVTPVPGASALLAALAGAGLPTDAFRFCGFLPRKQGERRKLLESLAAESATLIFYEAPHRVLESLADIAEVRRDPEVAAARELTKMHEEFIRGKASEVRAVLAARDMVRGEFTLVVGPAPAVAEAPADAADAVLALEARGVSRMDAIKQVARERGLPKREVYAQVERRR
jgi:16S rRNA (cytidine1402-2'-O)-methyltransferase